MLFSHYLGQHLYELQLAAPAVAVAVAVAAAVAIAVAVLGLTVIDEQLAADLYATIIGSLHLQLGSVLNT